MPDITIMCNMYNLHVLIDINYIKSHFYMSTSIMIYYLVYPSIHRNVSGIVLLEYLLYYIFTLNL